MLYLPRRQPQPLGDLRVRQTLATQLEYLREEQACRTAAVASAVEERLDGIGAVDPTQGFREKSWPQPTSRRMPAASTCPSPWRSWWPLSSTYPEQVQETAIVGELALERSVRPIKGR
jgi:hypothetical protein